MRYSRGFYEVTNYNIPDIDLNLFVHVSNLRFHRMHWQSGVEIIFRLSGEVTAVVEQTPYRLKAGDVLVIDSHLAHEYRDGTEEGLHILLGFDDAMLHRNGGEGIWLSTVGEDALPCDHPDVVLLRKLCATIAEYCYPLYQKDPYNAPSVREMFRKMGRELPPVKRTDIDSQTWHGTRAALQSLFQLLLRHTVPSRELKQAVPADFVTCVDFVQEHFTEPLSADEIAKACGFSRRSVFRMFQQHMGIPLWEYVTFLRVQAACSLLLQDSLSIAQIAAKVGLSDSQFYRVFQQVTGSTPRDWQRDPNSRPLQQPVSMHPPQTHSYTNSPFNEVLDWDWISGRKGWDF